MTSLPRCIVQARSELRSELTAGSLIVESINEALRLFMRQAQLERAMKQPGGARILDEQELLAVRRKLKAFPKEMRPVVEVK